MNIYDIADISGVSIATVSRVLNGSDKVSDKTRKKVLDTMDKSGYVPNVFARGMGLDTMNTIGILCPKLSDDYMAKAVYLLEEKFSNSGYNCVVSCSGYELEKKEKQVSMLVSKSIDAMILVGSTYCGKKASDAEVGYIKEAAKTIPVFLINGQIDGQNIYCTTANDFKATYEATAGLIKRGKKRILFMYDSESYSARRKTEGYEQALMDAGMPILGDLKFHTHTKSKIHEVRDILLARNDLEFDAVIATEDGLGVAAIKYAKSKGLSIPEEISIVGYNNSPLSIACEPELTSIEGWVEEQCNITVDNVLKVLSKEGDISPHTEVECDIIKRSTTDF